jgi:hypothetical protein
MAQHDKFEGDSYGSFREFLEDLNNTFKDQNEVQKARDKLDVFSLSTNKFFVKFKALMAKAGIKKEDNKIYLIGCLEQSVKWDFIDKISQMGNQPKTYDEWQK